MTRVLFFQLFSFGMVGVAGFLVDTAVLYLVIFGFGLGPYLGRVISFLAAATSTWALNRRFTFRGHHAGRKRVQWAKFVVANSFGGIVNYGTYAALIGVGEPYTTYPVLAVAAGSLAGMVLNFTASKIVVFRQV